MTTKPTKRDISTASPQNDPAQPLDTVDAAVAFQHFAPLVASLAEAELEPWNGDVDLIRENADRGVSAIRPHLDRVRKALPFLPLHEVLEMPALALALIYADERIFTVASRKEILGRQRKLRPLRKLTLSMLEILAAKGIVSIDRVKAIRAGSGPMDEAKDGVAIASVFEDNAAAVAGKHPFTEIELGELKSDGNWLIQQLTPSGATAPKTGPSPDALVRNRLYTELVHRHDRLYQAGVEVWGRRGVDQHIPALMSQVRTPAPAPAPAPKPTTTAAR